MRVALFCHTLRSDWNHGNAHFLRGVVTELVDRGHTVTTYEPENSWSYQNLVAHEGFDYGDELRSAYPLLDIHCYPQNLLDLDQALEGCDLALVHEWTEPALIRRIAAHRSRNNYLLLFHDTHHRSVSDPALPNLDGFDGALAFGNSVAERYRKNGWSSRVWTWHEAADTRVFRPKPKQPCCDVLWIGNWGDDERTREFCDFFLDPVRELGLRARVHGVRYPPEARRLLDASGVQFAGWCPNFLVPSLYSTAKLTVHIPRRPYAERLPGIPTIRVFEALACGVPLISAPWNDCESLFTVGEDFLMARDKIEMKAMMRQLLDDAERANALAEHGLQTIQARHTCSHRVDELLNIYGELRECSTTCATGAEV